MDLLTSATAMQKLAITAGLLAGVVAVRLVVVWIVGRIDPQHRNGRTVYWTRQITKLATVVVSLVLIARIWVESPARLASILSFAAAGLAFALQRVITAFAGYLLVLKSRTFTVGDRITMAGVRGDVIEVGFLRTCIMEMGGPRESQDDPKSWVRDRQYTGRVVSITNDKIFDEPVYNYTRQFPYIWEEIALTLPPGADRARGEDLLLDAARSTTAAIVKAAEPSLRHLELKYPIAVEDLQPRVYVHIAEKEVQLHLRFITTVKDVREVKDVIQRKILPQLEAAGLRPGAPPAATLEARKPQ